MEKEFLETFSKRIVIFFLIMMILFLSCILRVTVITVDADYKNAQYEQNCYKLKISNLRGTIYDCNMVPLTNNEKKIIAAVSPTKKAKNAISLLLEGEELNKVMETLDKGDPAVCEIPEKIKCDGISTTEVYTTSNTPAIHLLGYTDSENKGVTGIQAAYDSLLYTKDEVKVYFECNGKGGILTGAQPIIKNNSNVTASGVVTTLDINLQSIAEKAALNLESGAVIIADAKNSKIRAMVSAPNFQKENIADYLNKENSPLINKAITAYNVGSVFKPCVAIAGLESGKGDFATYCSGSVKIIDRYFKCHNLSGHGYINLIYALANSCNSFFYGFSKYVGGNSIYNTASSLNFGNSIKICDGIYTSKGNLPEKESLENEATLANFSIGQGTLLISPVSMLTLYSAIASDGTYYLPSVVEGTLNNGVFDKYNIGNPTRVMSQSTAQTLRTYLKEVVLSGTGKKAAPEKITAAGKTATAQTGKFENGVEICSGWFCGFFPAEEPEYVVIVFSENTQNQNKSCNEIFKEITDNIYT